MTATRLSSIQADDQLGAGTLERLAEAPALNKWMYTRLEPWLGQTVLEVGSGIGNISQFFVDREAVVLTDMEDAYLGYLRDRFGSQDTVRFVKMALPDVPDSLRSERFASVVSVNVLEHVEKDLDALLAMRSLLGDGGNIVLLVPAFEWLYGTLDKALAHFRRYTKQSLAALFQAAGFRIVHIEYFNLAGLPGWWFASRVLKTKLVPAGALSLYDKFVPLFKLERLIPWRIGQSLIVVGERAR